MQPRRQFRSLVVLCESRLRSRYPRNCSASSIGWTKTAPDRKSTRLNSSHLVISYAVFCLKKKHHLPWVAIVLHYASTTPLVFPDWPSAPVGPQRDGIGGTRLLCAPRVFGSFFIFSEQRAQRDSSLCPTGPLIPA